MILDPHSFLLWGAWYGLLASTFLVAFASLAYEIRGAQDRAIASSDQGTFIAVQRTLHSNFLAHVVLHAVVGASCIALYHANAAETRILLALCIASAGLYWNYTQVCEKRLLAFSALASV